MNFSIIKTIVDIPSPKTYIIKAQRRKVMNILDSLKVLPNPTSSRVKTCNSSSHSHTLNLTSILVKPAYVGVTKMLKITFWNIINKLKSLKVAK